MNKSIAMSLVSAEITTATTRFGAFKSPHEGLAIIQEEFEELKGEVFKHFDVRTDTDMEREATHLAAMAIRFLIDLS